MFRNAKKRLFDYQHVTHYSSAFTSKSYNVYPLHTFYDPLVILLNNSLQYYAEKAAVILQSGLTGYMGGHKVLGKGFNFITHLPKGFGNLLIGTGNTHRVRKIIMELLYTFREHRAAFVYIAYGDYVVKIYILVIVYMVTAMAPKVYALFCHYGYRLRMYTFSFQPCAVYVSLTAGIKFKKSLRHLATAAVAPTQY